MQSVHAVIFDLDGTLVDTLADLGTSMNRTLEKNGFPAWRWRPIGRWWATVCAV